MPFIAQRMEKSYYKRFQVKYRRRRSCKTDYYQRKKLVVQAKNKYNTPKYRLCVRKTATQIQCQIIAATITGDRVLCHASSLELKRFGLKAGYKNFPAAYCTGLLVGRRMLKKLGIAELYTGTGDELPDDEPTGEIMKVTEGKRTFFVDELNEDRRPFRCYLDVGLARTSLGCTIFGCLKGASDSGMDIPHNEKKFTGYDPDEKKFDASELRDRIFGLQVKEYMEYLKDDDAESGTHRFEEQFRTYADAGVEPDDLEDMLMSVHKAIRADPSPKHKETAAVRNAARTWDKSNKNEVALTKAERDAAVAAKKEALREEDESESEEESEEEGDDEDEEDDE